MDQDIERRVAEILHQALAQSYREIADVLVALVAADFLGRVG